MCPLFVYLAYVMIIYVNKYKLETKKKATLHMALISILAKYKINFIKKSGENARAVHVIALSGFREIEI